MGVGFVSAVGGFFLPSTESCTAGRERWLSLYFNPVGWRALLLQAVGELGFWGWILLLAPALLGGPINLRWGLPKGLSSLCKVGWMQTWQSCAQLYVRVRIYVAHQLSSAELRREEGSVAQKVTNSVLMQSWVLSAPLWPQVATFSPGPTLGAAVIPDVSDPRCDCTVDYEPGGLSLFGFKIRKKILFPIRALHVFTLWSHWKGLILSPEEL